ncbi:MAG TPA: hypothetical protein VFU10_03380, partial [Gaiellaceae bacterium]|nr:hypothetical protein [Gaiellaceae bacterium]
NNDIAAHLIVIKHVINDNGGTAVASQFTMTIGGVTAAGGNSFPGAEAPGTNKTLSTVGGYNVTESGPSGYASSFSADCVGSIALGETKTCTITNNDIQPTLTLIKHVVNDNGGTAVVSDFPLFVNATGVTSGATNGFNAGNYTASETTKFGYTPSAWSGDCAANGSVTLGVGENKTCEITNDDQPGTIIVKKVSKPVNTGSFSFTTTGDNGANALPDYAPFTIPGGGQNSQTLDAGTYTATESTQLGWILTGIGGSTDPSTPYNCVVTGSGGSDGVGDLNTQTVTIHLKVGDTVTCTFENTGQGVTRTQGFWATHPQLANLAWFGGSGFGHTFPGVAATAGIGDRTFCNPVTKDINDLPKLMGGFWSDISKTTANKKRSSVDQSRMQLVQQLLAAELNASAFGSVPAGGSGMFATWEAAYCSGNGIQSALQGAASFNNSGDSSTFTPGTSADSKTARTIANQAFWDVLP